MEFSVKSSLFIEPDGAYLIEGGTAKLQLLEKTGISDEEGNPIKKGKKEINYLFHAYLYYFSFLWYNCSVAPKDS